MSSVEALADATPSRFSDELAKAARRNRSSPQPANFSPATRPPRAKTTLLPAYGKPLQARSPKAPPGDFQQTKNSGLVAPQPAKRGVFGKHYRPERAVAIARNCLQSVRTPAPSNATHMPGTPCCKKIALLQPHRRTTAGFIVIFNVLRPHPGGWGAAGPDWRVAGVERARLRPETAL
jgi:hypothetical protein